jgi:hypothetical protein
MQRDVLSFAPTALAHRMWDVAGTMRALADSMERSARVVDSAQLPIARSRRLQRKMVALGQVPRRRSASGGR